jgi:hypothetical protein
LLKMRCVLAGAGEPLEATGIGNFYPSRCCFSPGI